MIHLRYTSYYSLKKPLQFYRLNHSPNGWFYYTAKKPAPLRQTFRQADADTIPFRGVSAFLFSPKNRTTRFRIVLLIGYEVTLTLISL